MTLTTDAADHLGTADALRERDRAQALGLYAAGQASIATDDAERILWISDQVAPTPPPPLVALFERVARDGAPELRRAALGAQATIAWHGGEARRAEDLWTQVLREPVVVRDRLWIRSCLNMARALHERRLLFEALVLMGTGKRAAVAAHMPYLAAFAASSRAMSLTYMGDLDRAAVEVDEVATLTGHLTSEAELRVIRHEHLGSLAALQERRGEATEALRSRERQVASLEAYGHVEDSVIAQAHTERLAMRFVAEPEARDEVLREFEALPERFNLGTSWQAAWRQRLHELRMQHALKNGDAATARTSAAAYLETLRTEAGASQTMLRAARLGRVFASELDAPEQSRAAFELASNACLQHVVEAERASREIPELGDATPEDWAILRAYRQRMEEHQRDYLNAVAAGMGPGAPAFNHLAAKEHLVVCAWCSSLRTSEGTWIPIAHFLPTGPLPWVSHGICPPCRDRMLQGGVV